MDIYMYVNGIFFVRTLLNGLSISSLRRGWLDNTYSYITTRLFSTGYRDVLIENVTINKKYVRKKLGTFSQVFLSV